MPSITYNLGIPAAGNNPSTDQPNMQTNTNSINTWNAVDHYTFSDSTAGDHKQVTFGGNNPASPDPPGQTTVSPPVLFTNIKDGAGNALPNSVPELFFYSGTHQQGQDNYISQGNIATTSQGSVLLMGGIIMKWGTAIAGASSISFTPNFPNAVFNIQLTGYATVSVFNVTGSPSVSGFSFSPAVPGGTLMFWTAIGN